MTLFVEILFWIAALAIVSTYALYPMLVIAAGSRARPNEPRSDHLPKVSLIVNAFNEEAVIGAKIDNSLAIDYPRDKLEIVVISDASTDQTDEIVSGYADQNVVLFRQDPQGGKSRGLTAFVPQVSGEVLIFSDANSPVDAIPRASTRLSSAFSQSR